MRGCFSALAAAVRQQGFFLTGTDEHGAKVEEAARAAGVAPIDFATQNASHFVAAWAALGISYDYFIRTSDPQHEAVVRQLLQKIYDGGYIYPGEYEGLYCVGCERFLKEDELINGRCPLHPNREITKQKEKNYFFKLSAFRDKLLKALEQGEYRIVPEGRHKEIIGKLKHGLEDLSISRESVEWGVKVPWDETQTVYVWIDALINYYSATQFFDKAQGYWPTQAKQVEVVHLIGKDILWFHAVIWEAFLMAAELSLPKVVAAHGFFTIDGQKMSKSLGNAIDPNDLVKKFGVDATRYLILSQVPFASDGDISLSRFHERYESDLANGLGNTFSRVTNMVEKFCDGVVEDGTVPLNLGSELVAFSFDTALTKVFTVLRSIDQEIDQSKPWDMAKHGEPVATLVTGWVQRLRGVATALLPFMPQTASTIHQHLVAARITKVAPLFPRLSS